MTEAYSITYNPPPPHTRKRGSVGVPSCNQVAIMSEGGAICATGEVGEVVVRGPLVFDGYFDDAEATAAAFVDGWFRTGDLGRFDEDGYLYLVGRIKDLINRGGEKISPAEIDAAIEAIPGVRAAATFAIPHRSLGEEVVAAVVRDGNVVIEASDIIDQVHRRMGPKRVLRQIYFVDQLPRTESGKIRRSELPRLLGLDRADHAAANESAVEAPAPKSPLEAALAGLWTSVLQVSNVGVNDDFFLLGGDSLRGARLLTSVKAVFGVELTIQTLFGSDTTVAGMARAIETVRSRTAAEERRTNGPHAARLPTSIPRRQQGGAAVLSDTQRRMWFLARLDPDDATYNESRAYRLIGEIDVDALNQSVRCMTRRHEILRTSYSLIDDEPRQIVHEDLVIELKCADLGAVPATQQNEALQRLLLDETQRAFDLESGPPLRFLLVRLSEREHVLLRVIHHIASDGWSVGVFERELSAAYSAFVKGNAPALPALPIQYADYAAWQRKWLQGEVLENQLAYWKSQLAGVSTLELPTDRPRPPVASHQGAHFAINLPAPLMWGLRELGRREGATLFMTLLAAFQVLLYRYSGQEDIAVGTPIAGRKRIELEGLIGFFANTLVLRSDLSGNPSFQALLQRVREVCLGAYTHQDLPFEKLVEELAPARDMSRNPLFQVSFALQNAPGAALALEGVEVSRLPLESHSAKFDLYLAVHESAAGLHASWEYTNDLFDASTIERMARHFERLLEAIVADPEQRIGQLPLLTEAERHQLLVEWNDTAADYPRDRCIHQLFEEQAARTPEAVAVVFEDRQLTYGELNARANQLAHHLIALGVGPEVLVGICVERSLEMVVGLLGILKAGGAYLPLDPAYPKERLAYMLEDASAKVLLTQHSLAEAFSSHAARVVCLDTHWQVIAREREEVPVSGTTPENLAYVIYTSGSTGRPKGVAVEHRQLLNYVNGVLDKLELPAGAHCALISTFAADLGHTVFFPCLSSGGCLHVISRERAADAHLLADYFHRHPIDCLKIVPSHLAALQTSSHPEQVMPRRLLVLGGEASRKDWVDTLQALAPGCTIFNHYGPTESTVGVLTHKVATGQPTSGSSTLPLGRPIANTQVYLLDVHLNPVPVGVTGELYVGGAGVARGYLHRPELTAERFIPNPFRDESGARLYKTGDLARYMPDGSLEFLGRIDHQVKLRGYRIEPGEIETVLKQHPDVSDVAVVAGDDAASKRLIAYVVPREERAPAIGSWRRYKLPNNIAVAQLNKNETDYMYAEIFERQAYLKYGITINDGDCIFDVGANIGLFTLFVNQICKSPKIYAFEPNPMVFEMLRSNAALYAPQAKLFNCGLSNETKTATFTFFKGFSLLSGFYANAQTEKELVKKYMTNQQRSGAAGIPELIEQADSILEDRFTAQTLSAQLGTLSTVMEEENIQCIDLLKINVEKSELDVLRGIQEREWNRIKQIVLEVDVKENLKDILSVLERQGYEYVVEQDILLESTELHYIYAIRPSKERTLIRKQADGAHVRPLVAHSDPLLSIGELKDFVSQRLPDYMVPSAFVLLETLPLTPNGKVDRRALPAPDQSRPDLKETFVAPRTPAEKAIAGIWADVLKVAQVGIHDDFFDLGGHSLLAIQVMSRLRDALQVELPLRNLFELPTVAGLAERIETVRGPDIGALERILSEVESLTDEEAALQLDDNGSAGNSG